MRSVDVRLGLENKAFSAGVRVFSWKNKRFRNPRDLDDHFMPTDTSHFRILWWLRSVEAGIKWSSRSQGGEHKMVVGMGFHLGVREHKYVPDI